MNGRHIFVALVIMAVGVSMLQCTGTNDAPGPIRATLTKVVMPREDGKFVLHIVNTSAAPIGLADIREGAGSCGHFYEIEVTKDDERMVTTPDGCTYAPGDMPNLVELASGEGYDRIIDPCAYDRGTFYGQGLMKMMSPPYSIRITYRLTPKAKEVCQGFANTANLDLTFSTPALLVEK